MASASVLGVPAQSHLVPAPCPIAGRKADSLKTLSDGLGSQFPTVDRRQSRSDRRFLYATVLGPDIAAVELGPASLPEQYSPRYMVDSLGFYGVSGKFPQDLTSEGKGQFAKEMVELGAVGFRRGEDGGGGFYLQFVHSSCLDRVVGSGRFGKFSLTI